ncbi:hypothetical protein DRN98_07920 [Methanosarcinales archaeon]|nr:MAG: hypothetical protein DRN98_07920 [Methanosarcinales archaeon]
MKTKMKLMLLVVAIAVIVGASMNPVSAALLTLEEPVEISFDKSAFNISVYPGKASYSGYYERVPDVYESVTGVFGDGTVLGYRFFNSDGLVLSSYADDGTGIVAPVVSPPEADLDGSESWANVWTTTDPGVDFATTADYTTDTLARGSGITGTIDISGLGSGTVYVICGGLKNDLSLTLTMSGAGQTDIQAEYSVDVESLNHFWVVPFDFSNAGAYDTITYAYTFASGDNTRRGRFVGVIVDGAVSDVTVEIHTPAMMTWSNNPVGLDATITDSGLSSLTYGWTAVPDGIGDPNIIVDFDSGAEDPVVTVTNLTGGKVTVAMTLTAFDDANPEEIAEASVEIDVYPNACEMAIIGLGTPVAATDLNRDCITNLLDFAEMASAWLDDYTATEAVDR